MTNDQRYKSTIKSRPFLYLETRAINKLKLQEVTDYEIRQLVAEENILQLKNVTRRKEIATVILKRLQVLDSYLLHQIEYNSIETSKIIVLASIMKTDRLFYEFMYEVIYEKFLIHDNVLRNVEIDHYFETKKTQSDIVLHWKAYTFYKLQQVYKRILYEAGILGNSHNNLTITKPMIDPDITAFMIKDEAFAPIGNLFGGNL